MAYMDGDWYVVRDSQGIVIQNNREDDSDWGSWVRMPLEDFDALVYMRMAQIVEAYVADPSEFDDNPFWTTAARAVCEKHPNLGSEALRRQVGLRPLMPPIGGE